MSDWFGVYSVDTSLNAGLDLEMPGVNKWRSLELVGRSLAARKVTVRTIKERARKVLELAKKAAQGAPEVCGLTRGQGFSLKLFRSSMEMALSVRSRAKRTRRSSARLQERALFFLRTKAGFSLSNPRN